MQPACPSVGEWQRFFSGEISDLDAEVMEAHLQTCESCQARLPGLPMKDPIRQALQAKSPLLAAEKDLVAGLIQRVKHLLQSSSATQAFSGEKSEELGRFNAAAVAGTECQLGPYRLVRLLGSGGMGLVYEAVDETLQRRVALKMMSPKLAASAAAQKRFLREARAVAALNHPNIVHINQVDEDEGVPFFVMEFLEGETLAERLRTAQRPTPQECAAIGRQVAEGLAAAHAQGLIHRDIKPANIFLSSVHVKILDFGLVYHTEDDTRLTRVGDVLGTPAYMSPEQARGERIDPRADIFSLGCILYELCTGFTPFQAINSTALLLPTVAEWPKPPTELNPSIPAALSQLIVAMLAKHPDQRPGSAQHVADALRALEEGRESTDPGRQRHRRRRVAATLIAMLIVGIFTWLLSGLFSPGSNDRTLSGSWTKGEPLARARTNAMAVAMDGRLYLLGGDIRDHHLDTLEVFDPETGIWKNLAPMPTTDTFDNGRSAGSVGVIDGKLHLAGGWRHHRPLPTKTLLIYDPRSNTWEVGPPMPSLCSDSAGGVIGRKFYVLMGSNGHTGIRHLFHVYDPDRKTWKELKPAPRPHYQAAGGVIGEKLYVVGGNTDAGPTGGLDAYDPATDTWTSLAPMSRPRVGPAAAVLNGKLVVLGGADGGALDTVEAYDPATDRWTTLLDLPEARIGAAAAVIDTRIYVLGGQRNDSKLASVDVFTLFPNSR